jgi:hypothetical protein
LRYRNDYVTISRALIPPTLGGHMARAACASLTRAPAPRPFTLPASQSQDHREASPGHHPPLFTHRYAFLIGTAKLLETDLTPSASTSDVLLIGTIGHASCCLYRLSAPTFPSKPSPDRSSSRPPSRHPVRAHQSPHPTGTWRVSGPHVNIGVRLLLLDTPSGTVCTGFDQGCKDRARKPFLAVTQ